MLNAQIAATSRPVLGFTLEGLSGREENLFKAIVRLLDHRTMQRWVYRPADPDVRVIGDASGDAGLRSVDAAAFTPDIDPVAPLLLTLSAVPGTRPHCLGLPIRANELEAELNSLGVLRVGMTMPARSEIDIANATVRLLRWPPAELVGTPERVKLATLMVSKPATLAWLQHRSGVAPAACAKFLDELQEAGVLSSGSVSSPTAGESALPGGADSMQPTPAAQSGLLARIRSRLGQFIRPGRP